MSLPAIHFTPHNFISKHFVRHAGFTLLELAVGLIVLTLMLGALLSPLSAQVDQRKYSDTQNTLGQINDALMGWAISHGYLPCPDKTTNVGAGVANDGIEDVTAATGVCVTMEGNIPWVTLGIPGTDSWGNFYRYRVTGAFSQRAPAALFTLASVGTLTVQCPAPACNPATIYTNAAPAVVLSHGKNGWGAINALMRSTYAAPTNADELENTNADNTFNSRPASTAGSTAGEFDDIVVWISTPVLMSRMVTAQKLP